MAQTGFDAATRVTASGAVWPGVYPALVSSVSDPDGQGRVQVHLPWIQDAGGDGYEVWARLATLMAGHRRGSWFVPDVGDEVLVAFEAGDPSRPYVIGALWNGADEPPASMDGQGANRTKVLRSRNGVTITIEDRDGQESLTLETPGGQQVRLVDGPGHIDVTDSNGNAFKMESAGITVTAAARLTIRASQLTIASGLVTIDAGMIKCSGVLQADTVISNSVISSSYTPGAGNIW